MDDGLPQNICKMCARFIESTIRFRKRSRASEMRLCHKLLEKPSNANLGRISLDRCVENRQPDEETAPIQKIKVEIELMTERDLFDYEINAGLDGNSGFCTNDNGCFKKRSEKEFDIKSIQDIYSSGKAESSKKPANLHTREVYKESTETLSGIQIHKVKHTERYKYLCEFCGKSEFSQTHMIRHQQAKHGLERDKRFSCSYCDYRALDRKTLEVHERHTHTKERPFVCDECGEAFYSHCVLKQHGLKHITDKPFQCDVCQKNFKSKSRLTGHIVLVHRKRKYEYGCPYCPKRYHKSWESRKHIERIHSIPKDQQGKIPRFNLQETDI